MADFFKALVLGLGAFAVLISLLFGWSWLSFWLSEKFKRGWVFFAVFLFPFVVLLSYQLGSELRK
jgi:hypothetical protein